MKMKNEMANKYAQMVNNLSSSEKKINHQINVLKHSMSKGEMHFVEKNYYFVYNENDFNLNSDEIYLSELDNYIDWLVNGRY